MPFHEDESIIRQIKVKRRLSHESKKEQVDKQVQAKVKIELLSSIWDKEKVVLVVNRP